MTIHIIHVHFSYHYYYNLSSPITPMLICILYLPTYRLRDSDQGERGRPRPPGQDPRHSGHTAGTRHEERGGYVYMLTYLYNFTYIILPIIHVYHILVLIHNHCYSHNYI